MCAHLLGILLLFLHTAHSQGGTEIPQQLTQVWASPGEARNITCDLPDGAAVWKTTWYKEEQDGSLRMIEPSYNERTAGAKEPLASPSWHCPPWRGLHLFTVSPYSASSDAHLDWGEISWNIGGETSRDQKDADMVDGEGVFSIWSLKLMSPELWTQGMSYSCSIQENRNISAVLSTQTVSTNTGNCASMLYLGIRRFFILLLIPAFALIIRMHLAQGNVEQPADQIPMREIPEDWAGRQPNRTGLQAVCRGGVWSDIGRSSSLRYWPLCKIQINKCGFFLRKPPFSQVDSNFPPAKDSRAKQFA
ncbi:uncharacterized protein LOC128337663 isoform X3 [Hemicordylus capensis]|uniref:uncharacterized protein LOC128337663 isoform X3 n=1 Tax=Hemicordylus capensis TaxID=884348 RepID=UPI0023046186|nr:uncharacterized protein LOC128337663 isoform X3 [Hemicordylus capensis]